MKILLLSLTVMLISTFSALAMSDEGELRTDHQLTFELIQRLSIKPDNALTTSCNSFECRTSVNKVQCVDDARDGKYCLFMTQWGNFKPLSGTEAQELWDLLISYGAEVKSMDIIQITSLGCTRSWETKHYNCTLKL